MALATVGKAAIKQNLEQFLLVLSIVGIGLALNQLAGIALAIALLVGASFSATDPVSVIALFRELGAGKRLTTLMEGESLLNDRVAVVAFNGNCDAGDRNLWAGRLEQLVS